MTRQFGEPFGYPIGSPFGRSNVADVPISWIYLESFPTAESAPLASPRAAQPGPGTTQYTDSENLLNIANSELFMSAVNSVSNTPLLECGTAIARAAGRAYQARVKRSSTVGANNLSPYIGFRTNAGESILLGETNNQVFPGTVAIREAATVNVYNTYSSVLRTAGCWLFIDNKLVWINLNDTTASMNPGVRQATTGRRGMIVDWHGVRDLLPASIWGSDYGIAVFTDTSLTSGDTFTGTADAINDFQFTLPGTPSAGDEVALFYRRADANNCWKAYMQRNAGNTAWDVRLDSIATGVATNRIAVTSVTADTIRVIAEGALHDLYTRSGSTWTKRGSQVNLSHQDSQAGMAIAAVAGTTLSRVTSWYRTHSMYSVLAVAA